MIIKQNEQVYSTSYPVETHRAIPITITIHVRTRYLPSQIRKVYIFI